MSIILKNKNGTVEFQGVRVSRRMPCPICAHLHQNQSWCLVDIRAGLAICPRVESPKKIGEAGYLHRFSPSPDDGTKYLKQNTPSPCIKKHLIELEGLQHQFRSKITKQKLEQLAKTWGVSSASVDALACGWDGNAWTFPMRNAEQKIIGYRRRLLCGKKLCVVGSLLGIIVPIATIQAHNTLYITEGESDLAMAIQLGLNAIARPGCQSCETILRYYSKGKEVVIIADNDKPGIAGAKKLQAHIRASTKSCIIITPPIPHKDLRAWAGHEKNTVQNVLDFMVKQRRGY